MGHHLYLCGRWALLGGIVLWLSASIAFPAHATITTYEIVGGGHFSGNFTLDDEGDQPFLPPFIAWNIATTFPTTGLVIFSNLVEHEVDQNDFDDPLFNLDVCRPICGPDQIKNLSFSFSTSDRVFRATALDFSTNQGNMQVGSATAQSIPEPTAAVLLGIGLLVLAGARWSPRRRELQQLG